jgi:hypothetical protein
MGGRTNRVGQSNPPAHANTPLRAIRGRRANQEKRGPPRQYLLGPHWICSTKRASPTNGGSAYTVAPACVIGWTKSAMPSIAVAIACLVISSIPRARGRSAKYSGQYKKSRAGILILRCLSNRDTSPYCQCCLSSLVHAEIASFATGPADISKGATAA